MGYLNKFAEQCDMFAEMRIPCGKFGEFIDSLMRTMDIKQIVFSSCGVRSSEIMLIYTSLEYFDLHGSHITVAEAAKSLDVSVPAVSRTLKELSEKGLAERGYDERDRRSVKIAVTKAGEQELQGLLHRIVSILGKAVKEFSDDELLRMVELHGRFVDSLIKTLEGEGYVRNKKHN